MINPSSNESITRQKGKKKKPGLSPRDIRDLNWVKKCLGAEREGAIRTKPSEVFLLWKRKEINQPEDLKW